MLITVQKRELCHFSAFAFFRQKRNFIFEMKYLQRKMSVKDFEKNNLICVRYKF